MTLCRNGLDWSYNSGDIRGRPAHCTFGRGACWPRVRSRARCVAQLSCRAEAKARGAEVALPLRSLARLAQDDEPGGARREARGRGRLGAVSRSPLNRPSIAFGWAPLTNSPFFVRRTERFWPFGSTFTRMAPRPAHSVPVPHIWRAANHPGTNMIPPQFWRE